MSELSELIEINRNIEKQNEEIIRLLKIIAGDEDDYVELSVPDETPSITLDATPQVGEVYFIEDKNVFRLSIKNNDLSIDNLTGSLRPTNFSCQHLVANESYNLKVPLKPATVILDKEQSANLPETLKMCVDIEAKYVFLPWSSMTQLIGAPENLMSMIKLDFYKSEEELIEKLFG